jgi:lactoylglutathione lyase
VHTENPDNSAATARLAMFDYLIRYTADVPRLVRFYRAVGGCDVRLERFGGRYVELVAGGDSGGPSGVTLAICDVSLRDELLPEVVAPERNGLFPDTVQLSFPTTDVRGALERGVAAEGCVVAAPTVKPWRCEVALLRDPDGLLIELCRRLREGGAV